MKIYIGVDPDVNKSGISFLSVDGWRLHCVELFKVEELIREEIKSISGKESFEDCDLSFVEALIESPISDSNNFGAESLFRAKRIQFRNKSFADFERKALRLSLQTAVRKGRCLQIAEEIIKIFQKIGIKTSRIKPSQRSRFDGAPLNKIDGRQLRSLTKTGKKFRFPSKLDHSRFCELTGITEKRTNEEKRDSALLLIQKFLNF